MVIYICPLVCLSCEELIRLSLASWFARGHVSELYSSARGVSYDHLLSCGVTDSDL